jgi:hypothetical protein
MAGNISRPGGKAPGRSKSPASATSLSPTIHRAQVIGVNTRDFTVDVQMESYPYSTHFDIPFMVPYMHQANGEGLNFMPEAGSTCWVCSASEEGRDSFVLGWTTVHEDGTYRGGRELLNPGDIDLRTRDGNFVTLRRGGVVQIGSGPVCQRVFIPIRNIIRDFAENYELSTPAGDLTWNVNRTEEQGDGHRGCLFTIAAKEFSDDPNTKPVALLKIGSHGEGSDSILTLETRDKGGGIVKTTLVISKDGSVKWTIKKDLTLDITGNYLATIKGTMQTTSDQDMTLTSKASFKAKGANAHVQGGTAKLDLDGAAALNGSAVNLGDALGSVIIDTGNFSQWAAAVTALLTGPPSAIAFRGVVPPLVLYKSTKVKA